MRPTRRHHSINGSNSIDQHTPQNGANSHKPTKQKIIGTLSSSHTTHAHPNTPHNRACSKQLAEPYTHPHHKQNRSKCGSHERNHQRSFSYRHLTKNRLNQTVRRGVVGHADSHKTTHTQPTTQISRWEGRIVDKHMPIRGAHQHRDD